MMKSQQKIPTESPVQVSRRFFFRLLAVTAALILLSRLVTLTYNQRLHADEHTFILNSYSLLNFFVRGTPYVENVLYPEGSYCFHLVFQLLGELIRRLLSLGEATGIRHMVRISSVVWFTLGVGLGMRLLWRYLSKGRVSLVVYSLTMTFGLFFLEQSRYGTGDMVSLMLTMLLLNLTAQALDSKRPGAWWAAAFYVCGVLGAVKYPQVIFVLIPLAAYLWGSRQPRRWLPLLLLALVAGFFMFSPKAVLDPGYILKTLTKEQNAYLSGIPDVPGNLLSIFVYLLLYADFPLLPVLTMGALVLGLLRCFRSGAPGRSLTGTALLFRVIVPGVMLFFFGYNLFASRFFFRTYIPFVALLALYTAVMAQALFRKAAWGRRAVILLACLLVVRGGCLIWVMSDDDRAWDRFYSLVNSAVDENWESTHYTSLFCFSVTERDMSVRDNMFLDALLEENGGMEIQPGQLVVTGALEYDRGNASLQILNRGAHNRDAQWEQFKAANQDYFIGQVYPDWYYWLFGGWVSGSTLSQYDLPCHYLYYRSR